MKPTSFEIPQGCTRVTIEQHEDKLLTIFEIPIKESIPPNMTTYDHEMKKRETNDFAERNTTPDFSGSTKEKEIPFDELVKKMTDAGWTVEINDNLVSVKKVEPDYTLSKVFGFDKLFEPLDKAIAEFKKKLKDFDNGHPF